MEEKLKLNKEGNSFNLPGIVQDIGSRWMEERAVSHGFSITAEGIRVDGY